MNRFVNKRIVADQIERTFQQAEKDFIIDEFRTDVGKVIVKGRFIRRFGQDEFSETLTTFSFGVFGNHLAIQVLTISPIDWRAWNAYSRFVDFINSSVEQVLKRDIAERVFVS